LLLLCAVTAGAQSKKDSVKTITMEVPAGLRVGVDLTRFAIPFFQPYRRDATVVLDARYNDRVYFAADVSYGLTDHSDTNYTYKSNGVAIAIGVNYNLLKKQVPKENFMLYGGFKYGFALFSYEMPDYNIHSSYWGNYTSSMPTTTKMGHWVELSLGIKVEVLKNLYLGWSLHERILLNNSLAKSDFPPLIIPGYGKGYKGSAFDVQYTISYLFPLWKVKQQTKL
jgi:hypothetical protein